MRMLECWRMDNKQERIPRKPTSDQSTMKSSHTPGSARQLARNKGLARISAVTLGVGAASALGAVAIAITLPNPIVAKTLNTAPVAASSPVGGDDDDSGSQLPANTGASRPAAPAPQQKLQSVTPPTTTNNPPAATSGAS